MASKVESEYHKFDSYFKKHPHVHCDPNRKGDVPPNIFCQINGKIIDEVLTCCPKNKYHYLVNGRIGDEKTTLQQRIDRVQHSLNQPGNNLCPTCKNMDVDSHLTAVYDKDLEQEIHDYYDKKYKEYKQMGFISCIKHTILHHPVVACKERMHAFINGRDICELHECPLVPSHDLPEDCKVHTFLDYAVNRWLKTPEGKVESEYHEFAPYFRKHPHVHCDPKRKGDVPPNIFCQLNGKIIDEVLTCCPENKYHYLVNGRIGNEETTLQQRIDRVQHALNKLDNNLCPTCRNMNKESHLTVVYDPNLEQVIHDYYDIKYEEYKQTGFICCINYTILHHPVVACKERMHAFINGRDICKLRTCPLTSSHDLPEDSKVHTFLDYAVHRWLDTPEGEAAYNEENEDYIQASERQARAQSTAHLAPYVPPVKRKKIAASTTKNALDVRLKGSMRVLKNAFKLAICLSLIIFLGVLWMRYKNRVYGYRLLR